MRNTVLAIVERHLGEGRQVGEGNYLVRCPFHKGGQETTPSFSVNLERAVFTCFTCKVGGSLRWLLTLLKLSRSQIDAELAGVQAEIDVQTRLAELTRTAEWSYSDPFEAEHKLSEKILANYVNGRKAIPLDPTHLVRLGFKRDVLDSLQVGFDLTKERIIYPIRDIYGNLAGVIGGSATGRTPKYLVYQGARKSPDNDTFRHADFGPTFSTQYPDYVFHKSRYLWNFDVVYPQLLFSSEVKTLTIVEGFKALMWLVQHGYPYTVALMTSRLSYLQKQQLMRLDAKIVVFLDNDPAGIDASKQLLRELRSCFPKVALAKYPKHDKYTNCQPDDIEPNVLDDIMQTAGVSKEI